MANLNVYLNLETLYFFEGFKRLSYGWGNPNEAAAFLALLFPILWCAQIVACKLRLYATVSLEFAIILMLSLTLSRGCVVAMIFGSLVFSIIAYKYRLIFIKKIMLLSLSRILLIIIISSIVGLSRRGSVDYMLSDASVLNRFQLWNASLTLIWSNIFTGCGWNNAGHLCSQWLLPEKSNYMYNSLVNGHLELISEMGLFVYFGWILISTFSILAAWIALKQARAESNIILSLSCIVLIWNVENIFSTFYKNFYLNAIPFLAIAILLGYVIKTNLVIGTKHVAHSFIFSIAVILSFLGAVAILSNEQRLRVAGFKNKVAEIYNYKSEKSLNIGVYVDESNIGYDYGKILRHLPEAFPNYRFWFKENTSEAIPVDCRISILFGRNANLLTKEQVPVSKYILFAPSIIIPINSRIKVDAVLLPAFDENGQYDYWREIIKKSNAIYIPIANVGSDLRSIDIVDALVEVINTLKHEIPEGNI